MLTCAWCKDEYTEDESPSDDFCSQLCSERWTDKISDAVEANDYVLDQGARRARRDDPTFNTDVDMDIVDFITMCMNNGGRNV